MGSKHDILAVSWVVPWKKYLITSAMAPKWWYTLWMGLQLQLRMGLEWW